MSFIFKNPWGDWLGNWNNWIHYIQQFFTQQQQHKENGDRRNAMLRAYTGHIRFRKSELNSETVVFVDKNKWVECENKKLKCLRQEKGVKKLLRRENKCLLFPDISFVWDVVFSLY